MDQMISRDSSLNTQLDTRQYEVYFGGIPEEFAIKIFIKTAAIFSRNFSSRLTALQTALSCGDRISAILIAHQLKSGLLMLGGTTLAATFLTLEQGMDTIPPLELLSLLKNKSQDIATFNTELDQWTHQLESRIKAS